MPSLRGIEVLPVAESDWRSQGVEKFGRQVPSMSRAGRDKERY